MHTVYNIQISPRFPPSDKVEGLGEAVWFSPCVSGVRGRLFPSNFLFAVPHFYLSWGIVIFSYDARGEARGFAWWGFSMGNGKEPEGGFGTFDESQYRFGTLMILVWSFGLFGLGGGRTVPDWLIVVVASFRGEGSQGDGLRYTVYRERERSKMAETGCLLYRV